MTTASKTKKWRETTLDGVSSIQTGPFGSQLHESDYVQDGTPIITVEHLLDDRISHATDIPKVSVEDTERLKKRYSLTEGDIVFSRVGSVDRSAYVSKAEDGWLFSGRLLRVRPDKQSVSSKWLDYWLRQEKIKEFVRRIAVGATMPSINTSLLGEVPVLLPPLHEQHEIAAVFSAMENKAVLLRRQNTTLEQIAQTIFNEWFVKPTIDGSLPKDWKVGTLGDVLEVKGGTTPSTNNNDYWDGDIHWSTPKDLSNNQGAFLLDTATKITEKGLAQIGSGLLPVGTLLLSSRAPIGYIAIAAVPLAINQGYIAINSRGEWSNYFSYLWLKVNMPLILAASNGSTFMEISKGSFRTIETVLPDNTTLQEFTEVVSPLFSKMLLNERSIKTLSAIRDLLLPQLMSGELEVRNTNP